MITEHAWYTEIKGSYYFPAAEEWVTQILSGSQGRPQISRCASQSCQALALWIRNPETSKYRVVYPQVGIRIPPEEGLNSEEKTLYKEAAAITLASPRAASALLRVLLEALLKRHLEKAEVSADKKRLVDIIDLAVEHLNLSQTLKTGLTAIRMRGNAALHDPYGLADIRQGEDLRWLFQAVDHLVDDLEIKPRRWAAIANT